MPNARARRAVFLPMCAEADDSEGAAPKLVHARGLIAAPAAGWPTLACCSGRRLHTASISIRACSETATALAPPLVGDRDAGLARRREVRPVVSRAQKLYEPEPRGDAIQLLVDEPVDEPHEVASPRRAPTGIRGVPRRGPHELRSRREPAPSTASTVVEGRVDVNDSRFHSMPPSVPDQHTRARHEARRGRRCDLLFLARFGTSPRRTVPRASLRAPARETRFAIQPANFSLTTPSESFPRSREVVRQVLLEAHPVPGFQGGLPARRSVPPPLRAGSAPRPEAVHDAGSRSGGATDRGHNSK